MQKVVLVILDGWGYSQQTLGNAIRMSRTPTIDMLTRNYPSVLLQASGSAVGLVWHEPGNSEVGHLTIGAGRVVSQYSPRISKAIEDGSFSQNPALQEAMLHAKEHGTSLHLIGLLSSGSVHANFEHLCALIEMARLHGIDKLKLHLLGDGKDSGLKESISLVGRLNAQIEESGVGTIVSMVGREYAMDRTGNWAFTKRAYDLWVSGVGHVYDNPIQAIKIQHTVGLSDGELEPMIFSPEDCIREGDAIIFFNFREDSMRQAAAAFADPNFKEFPVHKFSGLSVVFMTQYLELPHLSYQVAFPPPEISNGLTETISNAGKKQLHISETEKYAHVTYFLNCLRSSAYEGENDIILESFPDHRLHPEMRAHDIAETFARELEHNLYDLIIVNLANADILAHRGDLELAITGIAQMDAALDKIYQAAMSKDFVILITADHGNAESMIYKSSGDIETRHNPNPVPLYCIGPKWHQPKSDNEVLDQYRSIRGIISDIAPTVLELMGIKKPDEMSGESLLRFFVNAQ